MNNVLKQRPHPLSLSPREREEKPFSLGESEARGQGGDEGAILTSISVCNALGNTQ